MIVTLAARGAQLLLSAVVVALSSILINGFGSGHNPSLIDYGAFCGGAALLIAAVGILAIFWEPIQGIVMLALDALAAFFLLAGGLAFAIQAKVGNCASRDYLDLHGKLYAPSIFKYAGESDKDYVKDVYNDATGRCRMVQANTAFVWIMFGLFLVTVFLGFKNKTTKRGGAMV